MVEWGEGQGNEEEELKYSTLKGLNSLGHKARCWLQFSIALLSKYQLFLTKTQIPPPGIKITKRSNPKPLGILHWGGCPKMACQTFLPGQNPYMGRVFNSAMLWPEGIRVRVATSPALIEGLHCPCMKNRVGLCWAEELNVMQWERGTETGNTVQARGMGGDNCRVTLERESQEESAKKKLAGLERKWEMTVKSSELGSAILTQNLWDGERVFLNLNFTFLKPNVVNSEALFT